MKKSKESALGQLMGILVSYNVSAKEAIDLLDEVKGTYLERSWHTASIDESVAKITARFMEEHKCIPNEISIVAEKNTGIRTIRVSQPIHYL